MRKLIARVPILFGGRQYAPGDELPTGDAEMVGLWVEYGSGRWDDDAATAAPKSEPEPEKDSEPEKENEKENEKDSEPEKENEKENEKDSEPAARPIGRRNQRKE